MIFNEHYLDVAIVVIILILIIVLLCWAYGYGTEKCEKNGGVVIGNGRGYTCLTKEDMAKLRGEK